MGRFVPKSPPITERYECRWLTSLFETIGQQKYIHRGAILNCLDFEVYSHIDDDFKGYSLIRILVLALYFLDMPFLWETRTRVTTKTMINERKILGSLNGQRKCPCLYLQRCRGWEHKGLTVKLGMGWVCLHSFTLGVREEIFRASDPTKKPTYIGK